MRATEILMNEHRIIEQVLACLEKEALNCDLKNRLEVDAAEKMIAFFKTFADKCHHGKEEDRLFPLLEARGLSPDSGPTGVMRHEHDMGRSLIAGMEEAVTKAKQGDSRAPALFAGVARNYDRLLRAHIEKEDHCLFAMADHLLNESDQALLLRGFEVAEAEEMGHGTHDLYLALADGLAEKYGVERASVECACGHKLHACSTHA